MGALSRARRPSLSRWRCFAPTALRRRRAEDRDDRRHRPLRERGRHHRRRQRRRDHAAADRRPRAAAAGRGAGIHPGHDRHAAQRRRQGEPVFPARLQSRPRHRLRDLPRRDAGQHAHARARAGLHRSQFHDPGARRAHRLLQGPVLRVRRRFRRRRAAPTFSYFTRRSSNLAEADRRHATSTAARSLVGSARGGTGPRVSTVSRRFTTTVHGTSRRISASTTACCATRCRSRTAPLGVTAMGYDGTMDGDRPDRAARGRTGFGRTASARSTTATVARAIATACRSTTSAQLAGGQLQTTAYGSATTSTCSPISRTTSTTRSTATSSTSSTTARSTAGTEAGRGSTRSSDYADAEHGRLGHPAGPDRRRSASTTRCGVSAIGDHARRQRPRDELRALVENQTQWNDWFRSIVGLRGDDYHFDVDSNIPREFWQQDAPAWACRSFRWCSGRGTRPNFSSTSGRAFTATTRAASSRPSIRRPASPSIRATPLVRAKGAELGVRTEIIPNLQSSLAFWYLTLGSELVFVGDEGTTEPSRPSKRIGVEWSNHYTPLRGCCSTSTLRGRGHASPTTIRPATTFRIRCRRPRRLASRSRTSGRGPRASSAATSVRAR